MSADKFSYDLGGKYVWVADYPHFTWGLFAGMFAHVPEYKVSLYQTKKDSGRVLETSEKHLLGVHNNLFYNRPAMIDEEANIWFQILCKQSIKIPGKNNQLLFRSTESETLLSWLLLFVSLYKKLYLKWIIFYTGGLKHFIVEDEENKCINQQINDAISTSGSRDLCISIVNPYS